MTESFLVPTGPAPAATWFVVDGEGAIVADEEGDLVIWLDSAPAVYLWPGRLR